ncbi:MAG TPA: CaiB/BaiF CoA-transferase family protein [Flavobacteriales bacterium]
MFRELVVVETAGVLAGPSVGLFFAELGARVIKLENRRTKGDVTRSWKLPSEDPDSPVSAYFSSVNLHKEHRLVDLTDPAFREERDALLAQADVLITNHLDEDAEKLGLGRERLRTLNPRLVHGHIRGYMHDRERPAYDVVLQAESGYIAMTGADTEHPAKLPVAMIDILAGHQLKEGLLLALLQRERTGQGAYVEVSLEEAALTGLINQASNWLMAGHLAQPIGTLHPNIAPYGEVFPCADGLRLVLAVGSDRQFRALCLALDLPLVPDLPAFLTNAVRVVNRHQLAATLAPRIAGFTRAELLKTLSAVQVPAGAVNTMAEALSTPAAKGLLRESLIDGQRTLRLSGNAFRIEDP